MFPPPTTMATSTPRSVTPLTASAIAPIRSRSAPYSSSPMSASPDSFRRMRRKAACPSLPAPSSPIVLLLPDLEPLEAPDHHVLTGLCRGRRAQLLDGLAPVLVGVHVLLVQEDDLLEPLSQPALGHLGPHLLGLVGGLLGEDAQLRLADLDGHVVL